MRVGPLRTAQKTDTFIGRGRQQGVVELSVLIGHQAVHGGRNFVVRFLWQTSIGGAGLAVAFDLLLEAGHADLEELVQVGRDDTQKEQSLQQRHTLILRLCQDATVEGDQPQFAVEKMAVRGVVMRDVCCR